MIEILDTTLENESEIRLDSNSVEYEINYYSSIRILPLEDGTILATQLGPHGPNYYAVKNSIISKYDIHGKAIWSTKLDFESGYGTYSSAPIILDDNSIICYGHLMNMTTPALNEMFIAKLSPEGDLEWVNFNEYPENNIFWRFKALWGGKYFALYDIYIDDNKDTYNLLYIYDTLGRQIEKYTWRRGNSGDKNRIFDIVECGNDLIINGQCGDDKFYVARIRPKFLDVNEQQSAPALSLHPNPATDIINITGDMGYNDRVEIYTLEGVCLHRGRGRRIDVSHLAPGVYFVRVGAESLRFVKM
jgi:hypothetical protein